METQNQQVLAYLKTGKEITPMDALRMFGCFRLAGRIYDLRQEGWPITCERREVKPNIRVGFYSMDMDQAQWPNVV
jgi:hypothetical protein